MRGTRAMGGLLVALCLILGGLTEPFAQGADVTALLWEGFKAETESRPDFARDNYREVLRKDPSNYMARVRLGQIGMGEKGAAKWDARGTEALEQLLHAATDQPHRPEAYLLLAQFHYQRGYIPEGDRYMNVARGLDPESREVFSLLGQRHEMCLNYEGAAIAYSQALKYFPDDVYFLNRLYWSATQGRTHQWIREWISDLELANLEYGLTVSILSDEVLWKYYNPRRVRELVDESYYRSLIGTFRTAADYAGEERPQYTLPNFLFGYCGLVAKPKNLYGTDLYRAFIQASVSNELEYASVRSKLDEIRREALKEVAKHNRPEEKAKALYDWLKKNVLEKYDIDNGILAEQVITKKKYLCLSGAILYTLIGQEAGLPIDGVIVPGHAYALYKDGRREIPVELTAGYVSPDPLTLGGVKCELKVDEGFNVPWAKQICQMARVKGDGGLAYGTNRRNVGPVEPKELTAYQFLNVRAYGQHQVKARNDDKALAETEKELAASLRTTLSELLDRMDAAGSTRSQVLPDRMQRLREVYGQYKERIREVQRKLREVRYKRMKPIVDFDFRDGLALVRKARGIAPLNEEFIAIAEGMYINKCVLDIVAGREALQELAREQRELQAKVRIEQDVAERLQKERDAMRQKPKPGEQKAAAAPVDSKEIEDKLTEVNSKVDKSKAKLAEATEKLTSAWGQQKGRFVESMRDLEQGLNEFPCSVQIRDKLKAICFINAHYANLADDTATLDRVNEVRRRCFPEAERTRERRPAQTASL